jgi:hypothetical protein
MYLARPRRHILEYDGRWRDGYIRPLHGEDDKTLAHSISLARVDIFREFVDI